jgi:hypothetical protein
MGKIDSDGLRFLLSVHPIAGLRDASDATIETRLAHGARGLMVGSYGRRHGRGFLRLRYPSRILLLSQKKQVHNVPEILMHIFIP